MLLIITESYINLLLKQNTNLHRLIDKFIHIINNNVEFCLFFFIVLTVESTFTVDSRIVQLRHIIIVKKRKKYKYNSNFIYIIYF